MLVVGCTINLLEGLKKAKFKNSIEKDREYLNMPNLSYRKRIALTHRIGLKTILQKNIDLL
jgi:hypothetical protein